jgi:single-strand DNA-binding protein
MFHRISLIGRVGQEPQMRYTPSGVPVANFSVAVTEFISKDKCEECPEGWKESYNGKGWELTTWVRVTAWRGLAETLNTYLEKGRQVYIEGTLKGEARDGAQYPRVYQANDGEHRANYEITARTVKFLGSRNGNGGAPVGEAPSEEYEEDDALPF